MAAAAATGAVASHDASDAAASPAALAALREATEATLEEEEGGTQVELCTCNILRWHLICYKNYTE